MGGPVLEEKPSFKTMGLSFSSKLCWGSYIIFITKTVSKNIRPLIHSKKVLSPKVNRYPYKSTSGLAWNTGDISRLVLVLHTTLSLSLVAYLELLSLRLSVPRLNYWIHLSWMNWFHFLAFVARSLIILIVSVIVLSPFQDAIRMSTSIVSFLAQLGSEPSACRMLSLRLWSKWL